MTKDKSESSDVKVLIVDDHPVVWQGMKMLLESQDGIAVVGVAENGADAVKFVQENDDIDINVVLLDLNMPEMNGIETCKQIRDIRPKIQVVVLTSHHEDAMVFPAIKAGALSYLLKNAPYDSIIEAVRAAAKGEARLHPRIAQKLMQDVAGTRPKLDTLTARELEVLKELAQGKDNKSIAKDLGLSDQTVKVHVSNILSKLYLGDRTQAAIYALKQGLVPLDDS